MIVADASGRKKAYTRPQLVKYGHVADLTKTSGSSSVDEDFHQKTA
jgi:hypothetical protein